MMKNIIKAVADRHDEWKEKLAEKYSLETEIRFSESGVILALICGLADDDNYSRDLGSMLHSVICRSINDQSLDYDVREKISKQLLPYVQKHIKYVE